MDDDRFGALGLLGWRRKRASGHLNKQSDEYERAAEWAAFLFVRGFTQCGPEFSGRKGRAISPNTITKVIDAQANLP
jgi:hypothetical protein